MEERGEGWLLFAGIALLIAGIMRIFDAIWAFTYHGALPSNLEGAIFGHSLKTYGWVYLVVGIILAVSGGAVRPDPRVHVGSGSLRRRSPVSVPFG